MSDYAALCDLSQDAPFEILFSCLPTATQSKVTTALQPPAPDPSQDTFVIFEKGSPTCYIYRLTRPHTAKPCSQAS